METRNLFAVGATGRGDIVIMQTPGFMKKDEVLNLICWLAVISGNDIEDIAKGISTVESQ